jgi:hypothetical protein
MSTGHRRATTSAKSSAGTPALRHRAVTNPASNARLGTALATVLVTLATMLVLASAAWAGGLPSGTDMANINGHHMAVPLVPPKSIAR